MKIISRYLSKKMLGMLALVIWGAYITFVGPVSFKSANAAQFTHTKSGTTCNTVYTGGASVNMVGNNDFGGQFFILLGAATCAAGQYVKGIGQSKLVSGSHTVLRLYVTCCDA